MEILNAKQAFETMSSGQSVLCRAIGDLLDFDILENFPATVFFGTDYEFCIAPRFMTIGQLDLEVPECIQGFDDLTDAAMYYAPNLLNVDRPIEILSNADNANYLKRLITSKLLHKTVDDAIAHARAFITLNGGSLDSIAIESPAVKDNSNSLEFDGIKTPESVAEKPKQPTSASVKKEFLLKMNDAENIADLDYIHSCFIVNDNLTGPHLAYLKDAYTLRKEKLNQDLQPIEPEIETNPEILIERFVAQINECESVDAVLSVRSTFACNGHLARHHIQHLCMLVEEKNAELDPDAYTPQAETIEDNLLEFKAKPVINEDALYEERLKELLEKVDEAQTPKDVVALTHEVKSWSTEKRTPLITAINNRLIVLGQQKEKPSLVVQIQNAKDLTELDALEIDVAECDLAIQKKLLDCVEQRRIELGE